MHRSLSYLALGDSYTIGEGVPVYETYSYRLVQHLRNSGFNINAPEIIAKTGWTSSELLGQLGNQTLAETYDIISILIGVNNQYR